MLGGDLRQMAAAKALQRAGCGVVTFALDTYSGDRDGVLSADSIAEAIKDADLVLLPVPVTKDGERLFCPLTKKTVLLTELFDALPHGCRAAGGRMTAEVRALARERHIRLYDCTEREEFAVANAVPTAEGALALAMAEIPYTIRGARCLILGYGRIGRVLAHTLSALGADVTAAARKKETLAWIRADGNTALPFSALADGNGEPLSYELVFNTVPQEVVTAAVLRRMPREVLIIDLASAPGGVDREYAKEHDRRVVWALTLPGRTAPVTAGEILSDTVLSILDETETDGSGEFPGEEELP